MSLLKKKRLLHPLAPGYIETSVATNPKSVNNLEVYKNVRYFTSAFSLESTGMSL